MTSGRRTRLLLVAGAAAGLGLAVFSVWSMPRRAEPIPPIEVAFEPEEPYLGELPETERSRMLDRLQEAEEERYGVAEATRRRALREQLLEQRTSARPTRP